jgi:hypothetical protein
MSNTCPPCLTAAAGTELAGAKFFLDLAWTSIFISFRNEVLQLEQIFFTPTLNDWVRLSPIAQDSTLLPSTKYGPYSNPIVVVRPPRPTKRHWLGKRNYQFLILPIHSWRRSTFYFKLMKIHKFNFIKHLNVNPPDYAISFTHLHATYKNYM